MIPRSVSDPSVKPSALHTASDLTHAWLEAALRSQVERFEATHTSATCSEHVRLQVWLAGENSPRPLRAKIASAVTFGRAEVEYYTSLFGDLTGAPLLHCYHAAADDTHYHLLLEDVSHTHRDQMDLPKTLAGGLALANAAAMLHAHRWHQPPPDRAAVRRSLAPALAGVDLMLEAMRTNFEQRDRDTVRRCFDLLEHAILKRCEEPAGFSWIHGDLNPGNVLLPRDGGGKAFLIDHQPFANSSLTHFLAISDLAYAFVTWWPTEVRQQCQQQIIDAWHNTLLARGVTDYPISRCRQDWILCGVQQLCMPAGWCGEGDAIDRMRWLWEKQLRRVLSFIHEFDGTSVLGANDLR